MIAPGMLAVRNEGSGVRDAFEVTSFHAAVLSVIHRHVPVMLNCSEVDNKRLEIALFNHVVVFTENLLGTWLVSLNVLKTSISALLRVCILEQKTIF